jgi:hypothetical protein
MKRLYIGVVEEIKIPELTTDNSEIKSVDLEKIKQETGSDPEEDNTQIDPDSDADPKDNADTGPNLNGVQTSLSDEQLAAGVAPVSPNSDRKKAVKGRV